MDPLPGEQVLVLRYETSRGGKVVTTPLVRRGLLYIL